MSNGKPENTISSSLKRCSKLRLSSIIFCFLLGINTTPPRIGLAATYYLDVSATGAETGISWDDAWTTLVQAQAGLQSGDTVILRSGNYGAFIEGNVTRTDWVTYKAANGYTPVFSRILINNPTQQNVNLRFDGVTVQVPMPSYDPTDPPWSKTVNPVLINMANYVEIENAKIAGANKYLTTYGVECRDSNNFTIRNSDISNTLSGMGTYSCGNLLVSYNHIHKLGGVSGIRLHGDESIRGTVIEGNHIHDSRHDPHEPNDFHPPDLLYVNLGYDLSQLQIGEEIHQPTARYPERAKGTVMKIDMGGFYTIYVKPLNASGYFEANKQVIAQTSNVTFTPYDTQEGHHGGSGITVRLVKDIIFRNNTVHDYFQQGMMFYGSSGTFSDITLENNLFYDVASVSLNRVNGPLVLRNNTFIGWLRYDGLTTLDILKRYEAWFSINYEPGFDGTGIEVYNNIVVGNLYLPASDNSQEDYNIAWRWYGGGTYSDKGKGQNTFIAVWDASNLHGYPNLFEDIGFRGVTPEYDYSLDGIQPFFVNASFAFYPPFEQGRGITWDYHLAEGSPAINFGDPTNQPSDSLGTIGPDGFIRNDGQPRDASHHSAGCYEYIPDPNNHAPVFQTIGDKSVNETDTLTFDVNASDPDGDTVTYLFRNLPSGATFSSQTFSWTPSNTQAGSYEVTFIATDRQAQNSETITITVIDVDNQAPVLEPIGNQSVNENALLSFSVNATDPDGDTITYSAQNLPSTADFSSQTFTWTPSYNEAGTYSVTFIADDGQDPNSETITITVINVNRPPVLTPIDNKSAYVDVLLTFTIDANDPDGDPITYSAQNLPSWATLSGQTFEGTPNQSHAGNSYDVTFIANDGQLQDSETVTITVDVDSLAPTVTNCLPTDESIQVPLNNMITLHITDAGTGVDAATVTIEVNGNLVYTGDTTHYPSLYGDCRRTGTRAAYSFFYQSNETFDYDQTVTITVNATDLAGHVMNEYSYSFATEMRSFGQNKKVNSGLDNNDRPVTVCDSSGNIWAAWHAGPIGNRDIYVSKLAAGEENFGDTVQLTGDATDQCNPAVALNSSDKLYVVWQDNREGDWDIYVSTSVDGINWSSETMVHDPNDRHQVNPAIVIDGQSPNQAHVVWQDDREGNQDIFVATSSDGFVNKTVSQITSHISDQVDPAVAADSANTIYVVWTDERNSSNDIYGAASNNGWTNVAIVSNANNQSSPAVAAESAGSILHLLWVDDTLGDNDIYYASSNGLLDCPLTGSSIIDEPGTDQLDPTIAVTGSTGNNLKVFACWQDWRNTDTDLYFVDPTSGSGTNVFVGDDGSNTYQGGPVIGIDEYDHPYLIWADSRGTNTDIYYAGSTFVELVPLASELVLASDGATVGTDPASINDIDDVSVVIPAGACSCDVEITISKINNPPSFAAPCLGAYDFGPSGIQFSQPVTITIPYAFSSSDGSATPYWFNLLSGALSQQGITDVQDIVISPTLHALSFKTMHFTAFYLFGEGAAAPGGGGGGGGGCSVSASGEGNIVEFILPYIGFVVVLAILTLRDARVRKARNMAAGKC